MPLQLPNLDDRTFDDLIQEALSLIPAYAPDWTNHNPSDPGITLIEVFAYLSEILIYRLNRVTNANRQAFLNLIVGLDKQGQKQYPIPLDETTLNQELRKAVLQLRQCDRAITCEDFERHALAVEPPLSTSSQRVARAHCIPRRNLAAGDMQSGESPGHISVVLVPTPLSDQPVLDQPLLQPAPELIDAVSRDLEHRRLLTTQVHVVSPRYVPIGVQLEIHLKQDALEKAVEPLLKEALKRFLHPLLGSVDGKGWEFGRNVFVSEIYQLLEHLPGVDYITSDADQPELNLRDPQNPTLPLLSSDRLLKNEQNTLIGIQLFDNELVSLSQIQLKFISPVV